MHWKTMHPAKIWAFFWFVLLQKVKVNPSDNKEVVIQNVLDYIKNTEQTGSSSEPKALKMSASTSDGGDTRKVSIKVYI